MLSDSAVASMVMDNLNSNFNYPSVLLLNRILVRPPSNLPDVPTTRFYDTSTDPEGVEIPDLDALQDVISAAAPVVKPLLLGSSTNNAILVSVNFPTIQVRLNRLLGLDSWIFKDLHTTELSTLTVHLGYAGDNDAELPLKIRTIALTPIAGAV